MQSIFAAAAARCLGSGPFRDRPGKLPPVLPDGSYEAMVVDARDVEGEPGVVVLDLTILTGASKGEVLEVRAAHLQYDALDLLAMPCILTVTGGQPKLVFD